MLRCLLITSLLFGPLPVSSEPVDVVLEQAKTKYDTANKRAKRFIQATNYNGMNLKKITQLSLTFYLLQNR
jgi:hypothetical protein